MTKGQKYNVMCVALGCWIDPCAPPCAINQTSLPTVFMTRLGTIRYLLTKFYCRIIVFQHVDFYAELSAVCEL